jgi:hypothetical protein
MRDVRVGEDDLVDRVARDLTLEVGLGPDRDAVRIELARQLGGYTRPSMLGICVAVKPTTWNSSRPRYTRLKLWKSRPAAPAMSTRVLFMNRAYAVVRTTARAATRASRG